MFLDGRLSLSTAVQHVSRLAREDELTDAEKARVRRLDLMPDGVKDPVGDAELELVQLRWPYWDRLDRTPE